MIGRCFLLWLWCIGICTLLVFSTGAMSGGCKRSFYHHPICAMGNGEATTSIYTSNSSKRKRSESVNKEIGILLFDGICNFCNFWVDLLIRNDPSCKFRLCAIQTGKGKMLLENVGIKDLQEQLSSVILISSVGEKNQIVYRKSTAILKVTMFFFIHLSFFTSTTFIVVAFHIV